MPTRNIVLTDEQDALVSALVATGRYQNASEALRAGLRLLQDAEAQVHDLRQRLQTGLAQAQVGERAQGCGADAVRAAFDTVLQGHKLA